MSDIHTIVTSVCEAHGCNDQGLMGDLIRKLSDFVAPAVPPAPVPPAPVPPDQAPPEPVAPTPVTSKVSKGQVYTPKVK